MAARVGGSPAAPTNAETTRLAPAPAAHLPQTLLPRKHLDFGRECILNTRRVRLISHGYNIRLKPPGLLNETLPVSSGGKRHHIDSVGKLRHNIKSVFPDAARRTQDGDSSPLHYTLTPDAR